MNLAYHPILPDGTNSFLRSHEASDGQSTVSSYFRDLPVSDWTGKVQLDPLAKDSASGGFADVYKGYVFEPRTKERTTVAIKRLHLHRPSPVTSRKHNRTDPEDATRGPYARRLPDVAHAFASKLADAILTADVGRTS